VPAVLKSESLNLLENSGHVKACHGIALPLPLYIEELRIILHTEEGRRAERSVLHICSFSDEGTKHVGVCLLQHYCYSNEVCASVGDTVTIES
jgi:hypothetical protein